MASLTFLPVTAYRLKDEIPAALAYQGGHLVGERQLLYLPHGKEHLFETNTDGNSAAQKSKGCEWDIEHTKSKEQYKKISDRMIVYRHNLKISD